MKIKLLLLHNRKYTLLMFWKFISLINHEQHFHISEECSEQYLEEMWRGGNKRKCNK